MGNFHDSCDAPQELKEQRAKQLVPKQLIVFFPCSSVNHHNSRAVEQLDSPPAGRVCFYTNEAFS